MDFNKVLNNIVRDIPPSGIRKFFDLANEMEGVISLRSEERRVGKEC